MQQREDVVADDEQARSAGADAPTPGDPARRATSETIVIDSSTAADGPVADGDPSPELLEPAEQRVTDRIVAWFAEHWIASLVALAALVAVLVLVREERVNLAGALVEGIGSGAIWSVVAVGIALVYRSTRVINFAQGEFGTVPAFFVLLLLTGFDLQTTVDTEAVGTATMAAMLLVAIVLGALLAVGVSQLILQRLANADPVTSLVATVGVMLLLIAAQFVVFGLQQRTFPRVVRGSVCFVPSDSGGCALGTNNHNLVILALLVAVAVLLGLLFRTPLGTALLATAQDPYAASLHGVSPRAMSGLAWGLAGGLAGLAGVLGAGFFGGMAPGLMTTTFLLPAFTAAVLGGMTSMTGAMVGGLLVGLASALANGITSGYQLTEVIPSPPDLASFSLLLLVLLFRPRGLFGKEA